MKFTITIEQMQDPDVFQLCTLMNNLGAKKIPSKGKVEYTISAENEVYTESHIQTAIAKGIQISHYNLWVEVTDSVIDTLVPSDWPNAEYQDENERAVGRKYSEYTNIAQGENGKSLIRIGHYPSTPVDGNFLSVFADPTPDVVNNFITALGSGLKYGPSYNQWLADNVSVAE